MANRSLVVLSVYRTRLRVLTAAGIAVGCAQALAQQAPTVPNAGPAYPPGATPISTEIYGILDAGVRHYDDAAKDGAETQMTSGLNTSRFGLRGGEDLGDGLRAAFRLESGFISGNGNQSNSALFDRTASLGISGRGWNVKFGRQEGFGYEDAASGRTDPLEMALNIPNYASPAAAASKAPVLGVNPLQGIYTYTYGQLRFNNMIRFAAGNDNVSGGLFYSIGGVAGAFSENSARGARLDGAYGPAYGELLYQDSEDESGNHSKIDVITATLKYSAWKFMAGLHDLHIDAGFDSTGLGNGASSSGIQGSSTTVSTTLAGPTQDFHESIADLGVTWQATANVPLTLAAYKTRTQGVDDGSSFALVALGKLYLSKRTALYAELDHANAAGQLAVKTVSTGNSSLGYMVGINHRF